MTFGVCTFFHLLWRDTSLRSKEKHPELREGTKGRKTFPEGFLGVIHHSEMGLPRPELEDQLNSREGVLGRDMSESPEMCNPVCRKKVLGGQGSRSTPWIWTFFAKPFLSKRSLEVSP
ncbi:hypothetical protein fugu_011305 [Takifugu bimaculatus]|uniref:Uncharacterized protein n=1 Tax=Takifugu bimaculatus TaxID=433685 RepID=A0A4Z2CCH8_9TELE|nr:hypothetical protein fugu_011305 [Takifugu bimaculatus]